MLKVGLKITQQEKHDTKNPFPKDAICKHRCDKEAIGGIHLKTMGVWIFFCKDHESLSKKQFDEIMKELKDAIPDYDGVSIAFRYFTPQTPPLDIQNLLKRVQEKHPDCEMLLYRVDEVGFASMRAYLNGILRGEIIFNKGGEFDVELSEEHEN